MEENSTVSVNESQQQPVLVAHKNVKKWILGGAIFLIPTHFQSLTGNDLSVAINTHSN